VLLLLLLMVMVMVMVMVMLWCSVVCAVCGAAGADQ
jgi:hypothetical protein